jgi:hypothetical protein
MTASKNSKNFPSHKPVHQRSRWFCIPRPKLHFALIEQARQAKQRFAVTRAAIRRDAPF